MIQSKDMGGDPFDRRGGDPFDRKGGDPFGSKGADLYGGSSGLSNLRDNAYIPLEPSTRGA